MQNASHESRQSPTFFLHFSVHAIKDFVTRPTTTQASSLFTH